MHPAQHDLLQAVQAGFEELVLWGFDDEALREEEQGFVEVVAQQGGFYFLWEADCAVLVVGFEVVLAESDVVAVAGY